MAPKSSVRRFVTHRPLSAAWITCAVVAAALTEAIVKAVGQ